MATHHTATVFDCNTSLAIPEIFINGQNAPMGYLDRLAAIRKQRGLTQEQIAERLDVAQATVQRWEAGKREPSFEQLFKLAEELGVSPAELIADPPNAAVLTSTFAVLLDSLGIDPYEDERARKLAMQFPDVLRSIEALHDSPKMGTALRHVSSSVALDEDQPKA